MTDLLKSEVIDNVYSSPYKRAIQTVEGIEKYIDKEIKLKDGFKERILAEKPIEDFAEVITKFWKDYDFSRNGGNSNRIA